MGFYKDVKNVGLMKFYYEFITWCFGNGQNVSAKGLFKFKAYFFGHALMLEVAFVSYFSLSWCGLGWTNTYTNNLPW